MTISIDQLNTASASLHFSAGDKITKKSLLSTLTANGVEPSVAKVLVGMMVQSGRWVKGEIQDLEISLSFSASVQVVRNILLQIKPEGSDLTAPLIESIWLVAGVQPAKVQYALNALETENFLEQRKCVAPYQFIPRNWV